MTQRFTLRPENTGDFASVEALQAAAFEDETGIPALIRELRAQATPLPTVSLVAVDGADHPVGHVMLTHAWVDTDQKLVDVMALSPLGVRPDLQNRGCGTALLRAALKAAEQLGAPLVFLEGNHKYYGARGFEAAMPLGFRRPSTRIPEKAFQVARLSGFNPSMKGTFVYKDVHWRHGIGLYRAT